MSALALRLVDQNRENSDKGSRYDFRHGRLFTKDRMCRGVFEKAKQSLPWSRDLAWKKKIAGQSPCLKQQYRGRYQCLEGSWLHV